MAAERNSFPRRWDPCIIGFDLKIIWEMSVQAAEIAVLSSKRRRARRPTAMHMEKLAAEVSPGSRDETLRAERREDLFRGLLARDLVHSHDRQVRARHILGAPPATTSAKTTSRPLPSASSPSTPNAWAASGWSNSRYRRHRHPGQEPFANGGQKNGAGGLAANGKAPSAFLNCPWKGFPWP